MAHVDAYTNADQLSQTGLQNGIPSFKDGGFSAVDAGAQANVGYQYWDLLPHFIRLNLYLKEIYSTK